MPDSPTFDELYAAHADDVYRRCLLLVGSRTDADDVSQQVWVKVHYSLDRFRGDAQPLTWLFRIATNESLNYMRARRRRRDRHELDDSAVADPAERIDEKLDVTNLLRRVSDEERALLALKFLDGYSYREIADMMEMGESAVKMRIARLRERLLQ